MAAGRGGDAEADRLPLVGAERARAAPGDLLQREPQRLGVGELAVEQGQRGLQRGELGVGEGDRRQVEGLGRERVVLLLGEAVGGLVDRQVDAERLELGAVGVEAAREGVLGHVRVALDVAPDLRRGHGPALRHQVGDQRQLADQLLGVLGQGLDTLDRRCRRSRLRFGSRRSLRRFGTVAAVLSDCAARCRYRRCRADPSRPHRRSPGPAPGARAAARPQGCEVVGTAGTAARAASSIERAEPDVARRRRRARRRSRHRAHARAARRATPSGASSSTRAPATSSCCSTGSTPARAATRSRRATPSELMEAHRGGRRRRHLRRPAPARRRCCSRGAPRSACPRCPSASARSWTCSPRA